MKHKWQRVFALLTILSFGFLVLVLTISSSKFSKIVSAQTAPVPSATPFDQAAALASLREEIKGKEQEPAEKVFKNIQMLKGIPAGRLLAIMNFGYSRSLGVDCTHCHTPEKWESENKNTKQIAREMKAMADKINDELLKNIKNLKSDPPTINCTTCHRGEVKPDLNLPSPAARP